MNHRKRKIAVAYGGRSTEHEISIITGLQVLDAIDATCYEAFPLYIDPEGVWLTGDILRKREVYPLSHETRQKCEPVRLAAQHGAEITPTTPIKGMFFKSDPLPLMIDVIVPAFHGAYGEDGCFQSLLEWTGIPYTGSGPRAAAMGMNKRISKAMMRAAQVPVLPEVCIHLSDWDPNQAEKTTAQILEKLSLPLMVKPCNLGSSIAVSAAHDQEQLMVSLAGAFAFDEEVMVEPLLQNMYELNIAALEGNPPRLSAIERPQRENSLLTFEDKYMRNQKKMGSGAVSEGMASLPRDIDPGDVPPSVKSQIEEHARTAFGALDCQGVVRFDFLINQDDQQVYFNEVNTLPGSFAYYLWEKSSPPLSFTELTSRLIEGAVKRWKQKRTVRRQIENRVLGTQN